MAMPMISECYSPPSHSQSLKHKLKSSISCFGGLHHHPHPQHQIVDLDDGRKPQHTSPKSPHPSWPKSAANDLEMGERCRGLIGRIGNYRKRHGSADFSYDPASYSLNFQDEGNRENELPLNNFMARLPATPER